MGTLTLSKSIALITLFSIALIAFAINFAIDNGADINIASDSEIIALNSNINNNASIVASGYEETYSSILNTTIDIGDISKTGSQFQISAKPSLSIVGNILQTAYSKIFGSSSGFSIFIKTLIGFLTLMTILYVWKTWKGGDPD